MEGSRLNNRLRDGQLRMNPPVLHIRFRQTAAGLAQWQENESESKSIYRIINKRGFGKFINISAFLGYKNLNLHLQRIGKVYTVGALLTNTHICLSCRGGTEYSGFQAPSLEECFAIYGH
ncbi:unnamed protein product [Discosporangium mesarthrocarpum]